MRGVCVRVRVCRGARAGAVVTFPPPESKLAQHLLVFST